MLSIIIPTLNEENYLPLLLSSIKKQRVRDYEIIVAEAGSQDRTVEIARRYGCQVISGGLPAKGRNEGAKIAKGDILLFLDADVILPDGFLDNFLRKFREKKTDIASTALKTIKKKPLYRFFSELWNIYFKLNQYFFPYAGGFCLLVKKEMHQKIGGFDETIKISEDFDYVRRARKIGRFHFFLSPKFLISTRRFEKEGKIKTLFKYLLIEFYQILFGPIRSDKFNYRFSHYSKSKEERV